MQRFSFRPKHRLLTKKDFSQVFDQVDFRVGKGPILILARKNQLDHPRLGLVIRKKFLKRAVDRNQIKRLARENFRLKQHQIGNLDIVLMNRAGCEEKTPQKLNQFIIGAFNSLPGKTDTSDVESN